MNASINNRLSSISHVETSSSGLLPAAVGFFFSFRLLTVLLTVRIFWPRCPNRCSDQSLCFELSSLCRGCLRRFRPITAHPEINVVRSNLPVGTLLLLYVWIEPLVEQYILAACCCCFLARHGNRYSYDRATAPNTTDRAKMSSISGDEGIHLGCVRDCSIGLVASITV